MRTERVERIKGIAKEAGLGLNVLSYGGDYDYEMWNEISGIDVDKETLDLKEAINEGRITDIKDIEGHIERLLSFTGHTLEINHIPRANKAFGTIGSLSENNRNDLKPFFKEIIRFIKKIEHEAAKVSAKEICTKCEGLCCGRDIERGFSEMIFFCMFYTISEKQRGKMWQILNLPDNTNPYCRFRGESGCVIPAHAAPYFCKTYYCEDIPIIGQNEKTNSYEKELKKRIVKLHERLKELGLDLELDV